MQLGRHNSFGLYRGSLTGDDLFALTVLVLALTAIGVTAFFPDAGVRLMEAGFPLLAMWIGYRGRDEPFAPTVSFPMLYLVWYWLGSVPIVNGSTQSTSLLVDFGPTQWIIYGVGFAGLWCGLNFIRRDLGDKTLMRRAVVDWDNGLLFVIFLFSAVLLLTAWGVIVSKDGITILQDDVEQERVNLGNGNHIVFQVFMIAKLIFPLIFLYLWTARKPKYRIPLYSFATISILALVSTGDRSMAFPPLLTTFALRQYLRKPFKLIHIVPVAVIALLALSVSGYYRALQHDGPGHIRDLAEMGFPVELQPFTDV